MDNSNKTNINFMVCVHCLTFNHAPYIEDAMNGFCMQQTSFPFVCAIIDDASTDGEQEVIRNYLQEHFDLEDKSVVRNEETEDYILTFARNKTNHCCYFAVYFLKYNHYSIRKPKAPYFKEWNSSIKYIALCEGDDYWIDSKKLQKQIDFMESHKDVSCTFHRYIIYNENNKESFLAKDPFFDTQENKNKNYYYFNNEYNILKNWTSKTLTIVYRKILIDNNNSIFKYKRDVHQVYYLLKKGKAVCLNYVGGVYRVNPDSTFGSKSMCEQDRINYLVYKEFSEKENDYLLKEAYYRYLDNYMFQSLHGLNLFLFRIRRRIRLFCNKKKRLQLYNKIEPKLYSFSGNR